MLNVFFTLLLLSFLSLSFLKGGTANFCPDWKVNNNCTWKYSDFCHTNRQILLNNFRKLNTARTLSKVKEEFLVCDVSKFFFKFGKFPKLNWKGHWRGELLGQKWQRVLHFQNETRESVCVCVWERERRKSQERGKVYCVREFKRVSKRERERLDI